MNIIPLLKFMYIEPSYALCMSKALISFEAFKKHFYDPVGGHRVREFYVCGEREIKAFTIKSMAYMGDSDIWVYESNCGKFVSIVWFVDKPVAHKEYRANKRKRRKNES